MPDDFTTTRWTMVLAVRTASAERREAALAGLCGAYWAPIYAFLRRHGHDADEAADLTQAFFRHVIEKRSLDAVDPSLGRFRAFILASVKNFAANAREHDGAQKRGGGWTRVDADAPDLERRYAALRSSELDPEQAFERHWAATVLEQALARLKARQVEAGHGREFAALSGYLTSDAGEERPYREVAADLQTTETAVRAAVHRLRQALGRALRDVVSDTVSDAAAAEAELRHLLALLVP
jgi:RNA polymerase sigma-70 factor (ECF subfamily)